MINKIRLIDDLKVLHREIAQVYLDIFTYKLKRDPNFVEQINGEYIKEGISKIEDKEKWNEKYIHRSAYTLLNKMLFIRICEDKGFMVNDNKQDFSLTDKSGQKLSKIGLQKWSSLIKNYSLSELVRFAFKDMNKSYSNIPLYKEDKYDWLIPTVNEINLRYYETSKYEKMPYEKFEILLEQIIETLDTSRYDFNNSPDNVLGDVYEKFLDRDVRKELGQFYTPNFIIDFILKQTVEQVDVCENPYVKILDPACGSGHFLLMAYDLLRDKFSNSLEILRKKYASSQYTIISGDEKIVLTGENYWTSKYLHYHILKHCIYGADMDGFALQLTTINLLLKDLDSFITDELNLIECNSLVEWEKDYQWEHLKEQLDSGELFLNLTYKDINGKDQVISPSFSEADEIVRKGEFWNNQFDYIIGNPPYGTILSTEMVTYVKEKSNVLKSEVDAYVAFYERSFSLIKKGGYIGFINPDSWLSTVYAEDYRRRIIEEFKIETIFDLYKPFKDAKDTRTHIVILKNEVIEENYEISVLIIDKEYNFEIEEEYVLEKSFKTNSEYLRNRAEIGFTVNQTPEEVEVIKKIETNKKLGTESKIQYGLRTGNNKKYVSSEDHNICKLYGGSDIVPFRGYWEKKYLTSEQVISEEILKKSLKEEKVVVQRIRTNSKKNRRQWLEGNVISKGFVGLDSTTMIFQLNPHYNPYLICFLINSNLINAYYKLNFTDVNIKPSYLKHIPLPPISLEHSTIFKDIFEEVISDVPDFSFLSEQISATDIIQKYIEIQNREIQLLEQLFKENIHFAKLYNLTYEEYKLLMSTMRDRDYGKVEMELLYSTWDTISIENYSEKCDEIIKTTTLYFSEKLSLDDFIANRDNLGELAEEIGCEEFILLKIRNEIINKFEIADIWQFYSLENLYKEIYKKIVETVKIFLRRNRTYLSLGTVTKELEKVKEFKELVNVIKYQHTSMSTAQIVKEALDKYAYTWAKYKKNENKIQRVLIIKYDTSIYGLTEWSNEIHKRYFIDSISYHFGIETTSSLQEFLEINKSISKARSSFNVLKNLDFDDKEDYVEILSEKTGF